MFSPLMRFVRLNFRRKIFFITSCLIIIIFTIFTFYTNNLGYKIANKGPHLLPSENFEYSLLLQNFTEADSEVNSEVNSEVDSTERLFQNNLRKSRLISNSSALRPSLTDRETRPWFLTNGSLRLSPLEASYLDLWPEETSDPNDDRIYNQLMYVPMNYNSSTAPLKSIYLSATDKDWKLSLGRREFLRCPVSSCQLVPRVKANVSDLIFFKSGLDFREFMDKRPPGQIWARFQIESPDNFMITAPDDSINWTVTYRHDSEISVPYYKFFPYEEHPQVNRTRNYAANKQGKVAWFVSNCYAINRRFQYAKELAEYIPVDIYGRCGKFNCPRGETQCWDLLKHNYKFYLSFENSNCLDYITEKFWFNGLMNDVLPIVMGAHPSTYERVAPPNSYIHVDNFESPKHLAEYLKLLDSNDTLYNEYFEWKGTGQIKQIYMWCRICAMLHSPTSHRVYHDLSDWWYHKNICVPITWTNMTISKTITSPPIFEGEME